MREVGMKTIIKHPGCLIILMIIFLMIDGSPVIANDYFDTERFDVNVNIGADAKCSVSEKINLFMNRSHNGIRRAMTTDRGVRRIVNGQNITESEHIVYSDFISPGNELSTQTGNKQLMVYIGSEAPVSGYQSYNLSYVRDAGDNGHADFDDLTLPILPYTWDDEISEANFKITLPDTVDPKSITIYAGEYGAKNGTGVSYTISDKNIYGHITEALEPCEGVTLYLRVPKGYFKGAATGRDFLMPDTVFCIVAALIAIALINHFLKYQKKNPQSSDKPISILSRYDYRSQTAFRLRSVVMILMLVTSLFHAWTMMYAALRSTALPIGLAIWFFAALLPMGFGTLAFYLILKYRNNENTLLWTVIVAIATLFINAGAIFFCDSIIHTMVVPLAVYAAFLTLGFAYAFLSKCLRPYRKGSH